MQASRARLLKEYKEVQREKVADPDIQLVCDDSNIFKWTALIKVRCLEVMKSGRIVWFYGLVCVIFVYRDRRRLLLRVEFFSLRFLFLNSILCSLRKCGSWRKYFTQMCILRYELFGMVALLSCCLSMFWQMMVVGVLYLKSIQWFLLQFIWLIVAIIS